MSEPTREAIIAAAEQAMSAASAQAEAPAAEPAAETAPEPAAEPAPEPAAESAAATPVEDDEPKLSKVIRAKKEAARLAREREQVQRDRAEVDRLRALVKENPVAALKELGLDVGALQQQVINDGTPEAEIAKVRKEIERERAERERLQENLRAREVKASEEAFVRACEKHPTLSALYGDEPEELINKAYAVQNAYYEKTGEVPTREEIAEYLETIEARRYAKLSKAPVETPQTRTAKTLSPAKASTTASAQKPFEKMTPAEQKRHLIRVAQEAEKNYKPAPVGW